MNIAIPSLPLNELQVELRADPQAIDLAPYNGRKVAVTVGPAGEWLELID